MSSQNDPRLRCAGIVPGKFFIHDSLFSSGLCDPESRPAIVSIEMAAGPLICIIDENPADSSFRTHLFNKKQDGSVNHLPRYFLVTTVKTQTVPRTLNHDFGHLCLAAGCSNH